MKALEVFTQRSREAQQLELKLFHKGAHKPNIQISVWYDPKDFNKWLVAKMYRSCYCFTLAVYEDKECVQPTKRIKRADFDKLSSTYKLVRYRVNATGKFEDTVQRFINWEM